MLDVDKNRLIKILRQIGSPDSERIDFLKGRIGSVYDSYYNCASVALHLLGFDRAADAYAHPVCGLWANYSSLVLFDKGTSTHTLLESFDDISELEVRAGYVSNIEGNPSYFIVGFGGNRYQAGELHKKVTQGQKDLDVVIDPINQIPSSDVVFQKIKALLDAEHLVSEVSYNHRDVLRLGQFHQITLLVNNGKYFCLERDLQYELRLTQLDNTNFMKHIKSYDGGLNLFAVGGQNMPVI